MDKKTKQLVIAAVLALVFVALVIRRLAGGGADLPRPIGPSAFEAQTQLPFLQSLVRNEKLLEDQALKWDRPWTRDPFRAKGSAAGGTGAVRLSGIVWDDRLPVAILNDKVLKVGDEIEGYRVEAIRAEAVRLTRGEESVELPLFQSTKQENG